MVRLNGGQQCRSLSIEEVNLYKNENCHTYEETNTCYICKQGYYFDPQMNCVRGDVSGCAYLSPDDPKVCLLC